MIVEGRARGDDDEDPDEEESQPGYFGVTRRDAGENPEFRLQVPTAPSRALPTVVPDWCRTRPQAAPLARRIFTARQNLLK